MRFEQVRRKHFGFLAQGYLDYARRGPPPVAGSSACSRAIELTQEGSAGRAELASLAEIARVGVSGLLGWPAECVAFPASNTTGAIATFAHSIAWSEGDRVLVQADEHPGNVLPWRSLERLGVEVDVLPSLGGRYPVERLEVALEQGRVRVVAVAAVALETGERRDLGAIGRLARRHGALTCVDGAQALGALRVELDSIDAVCAPGRKWLLGPPGLGILALRPGLAEELAPATAGAASHAGLGGWQDEARRFEGGALPEVALAGLAASTGLLGWIGLEAVEERILALAAAAGRLAEERGLRVTSPGGAARSGVVWVELPGDDDPADVGARLAAGGVVARVDGRRVRLAAHAWCSEAELAQALDAVAGDRPK